MANNIDVKDGAGATKTLKTTDNGSDHTPHHNLDTSPIIGAVGETAPASDTASSGLNGRLQRIAQRLTSLIALQPGSLGQTGAQTNVSGATSSTTLLAANSVRRGATVYNDSTAVLYLLLSTQTASSTLFTAALAAGDYYEAPFGYTGIIKGIWVTATGSARVTEIS